MCGASRAKKLSPPKNRAWKRSLISLGSIAMLPMAPSAAGGCLVVSGAVELASEDDEIRDTLCTSFDVTEQMLCCLIDEGKNDGSIRSQLATQPTARAILCFLQGIREVGKVEAECAIQCSLRERG
ncbi:TetR family transcriptional regulator C-terminal domain-containing protein [Serratia marcescens]|uniref:TetR family transcriptional regulator C-terminal domain-containing protein n=2 Tax=Serratia TaxID=613 RepID=UPI003877C9D0